MSIEKMSVTKFSPALLRTVGNGWPIIDFTPYLPGHFWSCWCDSCWDSLPDFF